MSHTRKSYLDAKWMRPGQSPASPQHLYNGVFVKASQNGRRMDRQTHPLIEMRGRIEKEPLLKSVHQRSLRFLTRPHSRLILNFVITSQWGKFCIYFLLRLSFFNVDSVGNKSSDFYRLSPTTLFKVNISSVVVEINSFIHSFIQLIFFET